MTEEKRKYIKDLIRFYEKRGWDWGSIVEFLCIKYNAESDKPKTTPPLGKGE